MNFLKVGLAFGNLDNESDLDLILFINSKQVISIKRQASICITLFTIINHEDTKEEYIKKIIIPEKILSISSIPLV